MLWVMKGERSFASWAESGAPILASSSLSRWGFAYSRFVYKTVSVLGRGVFNDEMTWVGGWQDTMGRDVAKDMEINIRTCGCLLCNVNTVDALVI